MATTLSNILSQFNTLSEAKSFLEGYFNSPEFTNAPPDKQALSRRNLAKELALTPLWRKGDLSSPNTQDYQDRAYLTNYTLGKAGLGDDGRGVGDLGEFNNFQPTNYLESVFNKPLGSAQDFSEGAMGTAQKSSLLGLGATGLGLLDKERLYREAPDSILGYLGNTIGYTPAALETILPFLLTPGVGVEAALARQGAIQGLRKTGLTGLGSLASKNIASEEALKAATTDAARDQLINQAARETLKDVGKSTLKEAALMGGVGAGQGAAASAIRQNMTTGQIDPNTLLSDAGHAGLMMGLAMPGSAVGRLVTQGPGSAAKKALLGDIPASTLGLTGAQWAMTGEQPTALDILANAGLAAPFSVHAFNQRGRGLGEPEPTPSTETPPTTPPAPTAEKDLIPKQVKDRNGKVWDVVSTTPDGRTVNLRESSTLPEDKRATKTETLGDLKFKYKSDTFEGPLKDISLEDVQLSPDNLRAMTDAEFVKVLKFRNENFESIPEPLKKTIEEEADRRLHQKPTTSVGEEVSQKVQAISPIAKQVGFEKRLSEIDSRLNEIVNTQISNRQKSELPSMQKFAPKGVEKLLAENKSLEQEKQRLLEERKALTEKKPPAGPTEPPAAPPSTPSGPAPTGALPPVPTKPALPPMPPEHRSTLDRLQKGEEVKGHEKRPLYQYAEYWNHELNRIAKRFNVAISEDTAKAIANKLSESAKEGILSDYIKRPPKSPKPGKKPAENLHSHMARITHSYLKNWSKLSEDQKKLPVRELEKLVLPEKERKLSREEGKPKPILPKATEQEVAAPIPMEQPVEQPQPTPTRRKDEITEEEPADWDTLVDSDTLYSGTRIEGQAKGRNKDGFKHKTKEEVEKEVQEYLDLYSNAGKVLAEELNKKPTEGKFKGLSIISTNLRSLAKALRKYNENEGLSDTVVIPGEIDKLIGDFDQALIKAFYDLPSDARIRVTTVEAANKGYAHPVISDVFFMSNQQLIDKYGPVIKELIEDQKVQKEKGVTTKSKRPHVIEYLVDKVRTALLKDLEGPDPLSDKGGKPNAPKEGKQQESSTAEYRGTDGGVQGKREDREREAQQPEESRTDSGSDSLRQGRKVEEEKEVTPPTPTKPVTKETVKEEVDKAKETIKKESEPKTTPEEVKSKLQQDREDMWADKSRDELRDIADSMGLSKGGSKQDLIDRIIKSKDTGERKSQSLEGSTESPKIENGFYVYDLGEGLKLHEGFNLFGGKVFPASKNGSMTRVDIESFTGKLFTPEELKLLIEKKKEVLAREAEEANKYPKGPFKDNTITGTDSVDPRIVQIAKEWSELIKLDGVKIFFIKQKDLLTPEAREKYGLFGDYSAPLSTINSSNIGEVRKFGKDSERAYYIMLSDSSRLSHTLETVAHEMGHIIEKEIFDKLSHKEKQVITDAFLNWLEKNGKAELAKDYIRALRSHTVGKLTKVSDAELTKNLRPYWKQFGEWFADNTAKWMVSERKPLTAVEKVFSRIAKALRSFYESIAGSKYLPDKSVKDLLDSRARTRKELLSEEVDRAVKAIQDAIPKEASKYPELWSKTLKDLEGRMSRVRGKTALELATNLDDFLDLLSRAKREFEFSVKVKYPNKESALNLTRTDGLAQTTNFSIGNPITPRKWKHIDIVDRESFKQALKELFKLKSEKGDSFLTKLLAKVGIKGKGDLEAVLAITDTRAEAWSKAYNSTPDEWYKTRFARIQTGFEGPIINSNTVKGMVDFLSDGRAIISAWKRADVSTIIHELGHVLRRDLSDADLAVLEKKFGKFSLPANFSTLTKSEQNRLVNGVREAEEKFARSWEAYLYEGKAPITKLQKVFEKIKGFLRDIYNGVVGSSIDIKLDPEVKRVFDNLLLEGGAKDMRRDGLGQFPASAYSPMFYSKLAKEVNGFKNDKFTGEQLLNYLKGKVKEEELFWTGLDDLLKGDNLQKYMAEINSPANIDYRKFGNEFDRDVWGATTDLPVTLTPKEAVLDFLKRNQVELKEVELGGSQEVSISINETSWQPMGKEGVQFTLKFPPLEGGLTEVRGKKLPEGDDYAYEALVMHRESSTGRDTKVKVYADNLNELRELAVMQLNEILNRDKDLTDKTIWRGITLDNGKNYREFIIEAPLISENYDKHWGNVPGVTRVLYHIRTTDRIVDGKKVLFIEEIQSDLHQQGREEGYKGDKQKQFGMTKGGHEVGVLGEGAILKSKPVNDILQRHSDLSSDLRKFIQDNDGLSASYDFGNHHEAFTNDIDFVIRNNLSFDIAIRNFKDRIPDVVKNSPEYSKKLDSLIKADIALFRSPSFRKYWSEHKTYRGRDHYSPQAPFKGNLWVENAIKRIIRKASEEGYDSVAWTTGKQQGIRNNVFTHGIDRIDWSRKPKSWDFTVNVDYTNPDTGNSGTRTFTGDAKKIASYIGKGLASRILREAINKDKDKSISKTVEYPYKGALIVGETLTPKNKRSSTNTAKYSGVITDVDTISRNEGPKFYDVQLANLTKNILKKLDPEISISKKEMDFGKDGKEAVPYFELSNKVKDKVLYEGQELFQDRKVDPFYSQAVKSVSEFKGKKFLGAQLKGFLKGKVKEDEMYWTGLDEYLESNKSKLITKDDVLNYLKNNLVEVKEVVKDDKLPEFNLHPVIMSVESGPVKWQVRDSENTHYFVYITKSDKGSKYSVTMERYRGTSGGGEFKTLEEAKEAAFKQAGYAYKGEEGSRITKYGDRYTHERLKEPGGEDYTELLLTLPGVKDKYTHPHWEGQENVLASIRFTTRYDAEGNKVLFIEEIQSDWHQQGQKKGYNSPEYKKVEDEYNKRKIDLLNKGASLDEIAALNGELNYRLQKLRNEGKGGDIPDAPFKKNWDELSMKRVIRWAAENGFDKVAWTTGDQQVARYPDMNPENKAGLKNRYDVRLLNVANDVLKKLGNGKVGKSVIPEFGQGKDEYGNAYYHLKKTEKLNYKGVNEAGYHEIMVTPVEGEGSPHLVRGPLSMMQDFFGSYLVDRMTKEKSFSVVRGEIEKLLDYYKQFENDGVPSFDLTKVKDKVLYEGQPLFQRMRDLEPGELRNKPKDTNYLVDLTDYTNKLYRETSPDMAYYFIPGNAYASLGREQVYFSNTPDLATGQGNNKGVLLEFSSEGIKGQVNRQKPTWSIAWDSGSAEFVAKHTHDNTYKNNLLSFTVEKGVKLPGRYKFIVSKLKEQGWVEIKNNDGSTTYRKPPTESDPLGLFQTVEPNTKKSFGEKVSDTAKGILKGEGLIKPLSAGVKAYESFSEWASTPDTGAKDKHRLATVRDAFRNQLERFIGDPGFGLDRPNQKLREKWNMGNAPTEELAPFLNKFKHEAKEVHKGVDGYMMHLVDLDHLVENLEDSKTLLDLEAKIKELKGVRDSLSTTDPEHIRKREKIKDELTQVREDLKAEKKKIVDLYLETKEVKKNKEAVDLINQYVNSDTLKPKHITSKFMSEEKYRAEFKTSTEYNNSKVDKLIKEGVALKRRFGTLTTHGLEVQPSYSKWINMIKRLFFNNVVNKIVKQLDEFWKQKKGHFSTDLANTYKLLHGLTPQEQVIFDKWMDGEILTDDPLFTTKVRTAAEKFLEVAGPMAVEDFYLRTPTAKLPKEVADNMGKEIKKLKEYDRSIKDSEGKTEWENIKSNTVFQKKVINDAKKVAMANPQIKKIINKHLADLSTIKEDGVRMEVTEAEAKNFLGWKLKSKDEDKGVFIVEKSGEKPKTLKLDQVGDYVDPNTGSSPWKETRTKNPEGKEVITLTRKLNDHEVDEATERARGAMNLLLIAKMLPHTLSQSNFYADLVRTRSAVSKDIENLTREEIRDIADKKPNLAGEPEWKKITDKNYGALYNKWVSGDLARFIGYQDRPDNQMLQLAKRIVREFKTNHTTRNPGTHVTNFLSNGTMATTHGVFQSMPMTAKLFRDRYYGKDKDKALAEMMFEDADRHGLSAIEWAEMHGKVSLSEQKLDHLKGMWQKAVGLKNQGGMGYVKALWQMLKLTDTFAKDLYEASDILYRYNHYFSRVDAAVRNKEIISIEEYNKLTRLPELTKDQKEVIKKYEDKKRELATEAREAYVSYQNQNSVLLRTLQKYPFFPFFSFFAGIVPQLMKLTVTKPFAVFGVILSLGLLETLLLEEEDNEHAREYLAPYRQGRLFGAPESWNLVPHRSVEVREGVYLDVAKYLMADQIFGMNTYTAWPAVPQFAIPYGPLMWPFQWMMNAKYGPGSAQISDRDDSAGKRVFDWGAWQLKQIFPSWVSTAAEANFGEKPPAHPWARGAFGFTTAEPDYSRSPKNI